MMKDLVEKAGILKPHGRIYWKAAIKGKGDDEMLLQGRTVC